MTPVRLVSFELADGAELLPELRAGLERVLHVEASVTPMSLELSRCFDRVRGQLDAQRVLDDLAERAESGFVLGVTDSDLFVPVFTFVLGDAKLDGPVAVVSTFRLREERYGLRANPELLRSRLLKGAVHELGHCQGLTHCLSSSCVMFAAGGVEEVDSKSEELCTRCRGRLAAGRR